MTKQDTLVRIIGKDVAVRGLACSTTELCREAATRHQTSPVGSAALARALTAASLMGALLKSLQQIAIKFEGDGVFSKLLVEADNYGRIRGYISEIEAESADFTDIPAALGQGTITVVRNLGLPHLAKGVISITAGTIDEDLTYYLIHSEQIPSYIKVDVEMSEDGQEILCAGGVLLQLMGDGDPSEITNLKERMAELPPITAMLQSGSTSADILDELFNGLEYEFLEEYPLKFVCNCSWERSRKALALLGRVELESLLEEGEAVVNCHFCHEDYRFSQEDIEDLIDDLDLF